MMMTMTMTTLMMTMLQKAKVMTSEWRWFVFGQFSRFVVNEENQKTAIRWRSLNETEATYTVYCKYIEYTPLPFWISLGGSSASASVSGTGGEGTLSFSSLGNSSSSGAGISSISSGYTSEYKEHDLCSAICYPHASNQIVLSVTPSICLVG